MSKNKEIIKLCPNYYKIINFHPIEEDKITDKIFALYKEYIFSININDELAVNEIKELDAALNKYINDYSFRKEIQKQIMSFKVKNNTDNIIKAFINVILKTYANYEDYTTRVIYISRWI